MPMKRMIELDAMHMERSNVQKAIELTTWYANTPGFAMFGDRFHENVNDLMNDLLPEDFDEKVGDSVFFSRFEVVGGELKIILQADTGNGDEQVLDVIITD